MVGRAHLLVTGCGFHVAVIDAPGHGDRPRTARDEQEMAELRTAQAAGEPEGPIVVPYNARLAELAVPEYRAILYALQELPEIRGEEPVGYVGIGLGTAIGVPLVVVEPRITAAVFGLMTSRGPAGARTASYPSPPGPAPPAGRSRGGRGRTAREALRPSAPPAMAHGSRTRHALTRTGSPTPVPHHPSPTGRELLLRRKPGNRALSHPGRRAVATVTELPRETPVSDNTWTSVAE